MTHYAPRRAPTRGFAYTGSPVGVLLHLDVAPHSLGARQWSAAWDETLRLLEAVRPALVGLDWRVIAGERVVVYTRAIERSSGSAREWCVVGDARSRVFGEDFSLSNDLDDYLGRAGASKPSDVLHAIAAAPEGVTAKGVVDVFGNRTGGEVQRAALLAAGLWLEHRFPLAVSVSGDLSARQVAAARAYVRRGLGRDVPGPLRLDPARLVERLRGVSQRAALAEAVTRVYLGELDTLSSALAREIDERGYDAWLGARLLDGGGALALRGALAAGLEWERVLEVAARAGFEDDRLTALIADAVARRPERAAPRHALSTRAGVLAKVQRARWSAATRFVRSPARVTKELTPLLGARAAGRVRRAITQHVATIASLDARLARAARGEPVVLEELASLTTLRKAPERLQEGIARFAHDLERLRRLLLKERGERGELARELLGSDVAAARKLLVRVLAADKLRLTERAWDAVCHVRDAKVLRVYALTALFDHPDLAVVSMRRAVLESPAVRRRVTEIVGARR